MNINQKLQLVTVVPLVFALTAAFIVNYYQHQSLSDQIIEASRSNITMHREKELTNYISIAEGAIEHIYKDENIDQETAKQQVVSILSNMRFGENGYFFGYDYDGNNLFLPGQEWRVGKNWIHMEDRNGVRIIEGLISAGKSGGGFLNYEFHQPSRDGEPGNKLARATPLEKWQWIFGTGVYIDDINEQTQLLSDSISNYIDKTSTLTILIGLLSVIAVFFAGQFIRISEKRLANKKLHELNGRILQTQEEECKRVSRELHDGISQTIAAARFSLETAQLKQESGLKARNDLDHAMTLIQKIMVDIRNISHQLHPGILEDYGLGAALDELGEEFSKRSGIKVVVNRLSVRNIVSEEIKVALYRIAQEALTNIERHSKASEVVISLSLEPDWLLLSIEDNGQGLKHTKQNTKKIHHEGIGLRNMKERLSFYNGKLKVLSTKEGMEIQARIPQSELRYNATNTSKVE
ncbi:MAG: histidine kinase [Gammaproteobacteria bacterium]|nr:histidine kinase [Gammaproteobacteria bacterium]